MAEGGGGDLSGHPLRPYVPDLAIEWLRDHADERARAVEGTMAFVDISGFTALARRLTRQGAVGSEELSDILHAVFSALLAHARREGGDLVKWGGDAVLLLFRGADHATRAVRAAVDMRTELRTAGRAQSSAGRVNLRMSVGLHSGTFHFFLVGDPALHRELVVSGPAASRTAELEELANAGQVLVSHETAALLDASVLGAAVEGARLIRRSPSPGPPTPSIEPEGEVDVASLLTPPLREHLLAAAGTSEHRAVGVAFVQFSGTDELLASAGPEAVAEALDELVRNAQDACARHATTFLESDIGRNGGKLMLVSGAPGGGRDVEDRILGTARLIVDRAFRLPLRAGVNRGAVFGGDFGPDHRRTYSVKGDAINIAARVMGKTPWGQVLATLEVVARAHVQVDVREVEPFLVKGHVLPIVAVAVEAVGDPVDEEATEVVATFAGRERELAAVRPALARAATGSGALVHVVADPGLGKSAFVGQLCDEVPDYRVVRCPSGHFGGAAAYNAVRRMLRELAGVHGGTPRDDQVAALRRLVVERCPELLVWFPLLAAVLDVAVPDTDETRDLDERFRVGKLVEVVVTFLRQVATTPTIFLFEDADEMDESSVTIVAEMAEQLDVRPWVLLVTRSRGPGGLQPVPESPFVAVELPPLDEKESLALLEAWTRDSPVSDTLLRAIAEKAGGNPLFMEALLDVARERGSVAGLPDSVGAVVAGQIDRLTPRDRTVLRFASVLGDQFALASLRTLVSGQGWAVDPDDLRRLDAFIEPQGTDTVWWRFTNAVVRDAAYHGLPFRLRRRMHLQAGEMLERSVEDRAPVAEQLATHFFEAGELSRAWVHARVAGNRSRAVYSYAAALDQYQRAAYAAVRVDGVPPREIADILEAQGDVADLAGLSRESIAAYRRAREFVRDDPLALAALMTKEVALHQRVGQLTTALRIIAHARGLARDDSARACRVRSQLTGRLAYVSHVRSKHADALRWSAIAVEEALRSEDTVAVAFAYNVRDLTLTGAGKVGDQPYGELALARYEEAGDLLMQSRCINNLAMRAFLEGQWPLAQDRFAMAAEVLHRVGDTANEGWAAYNQAETAIRQGRFDFAERQLERAERSALIADDVELLALILRETGKVRVGEGRVAEARSAFAEARAGLATEGLDNEVVEIESGLAECLAIEGDLDGAEASLVAALETAEAMGHGSVLPALHCHLGAVRLRRGLREAAAEAFEAGLADPDAGDGGYARSLNLLGLARARGETTSGPGTEARATLASLGVVVLPYGLDAVTA